MGLVDGHVTHVHSCTTATSIMADSALRGLEGLRSVAEIEATSSTSAQTTSNALLLSLACERQSRVNVRDQAYSSPLVSSKSKHSAGHAVLADHTGLRPMSSMHAQGGHSSASKSPLSLQQSAQSSAQAKARAAAEATFARGSSSTDRASKRVKVTIVVDTDTDSDDSEGVYLASDNRCSGDAALAKRLNWEQSAASHSSCSDDATSLALARRLQAEENASASHGGFAPGTPAWCRMHKVCFCVVARYLNVNRTQLHAVCVWH